MSGVEITGDKMPQPQTVLGVLEEEARTAARAAGEHTVDVARGNLRSQGPLSQGIRAYVTKTPTGVAVSVRIVPKLRQLAAWVGGGTGVYVEHHSRIRGRQRVGGKRGPLRTPRGYRASARGQRPQRFMERAEAEAEARAEQLLEQGAVDATRRLGQL